LPDRTPTVIDALASLAKTLLLPPGGPLWIGLLGILLWRWRRRLGQRLLVVGVLLGYGLSIPFTASWLNRSLQADPPLAAAAPIPEEVGVIVVLGGGLRDDAPEYGEGPTLHDRTLGRVRYAARLARQTGLPVLATGGRPKEEDPPEAELMREILEREFGIGPVMIETASRDTWENAIYSAALLREHRIDTILLVSTATHLPRAVAAFERQGLNVIPAPTLFLNDQPKPADLTSWLPSAAAVAAIHYAGHEWLGRLWYAMRYAPPRDFQVSR
jgi:uncharacterized SAM-binding protein YcdF (DUF218 family)